MLRTYRNLPEIPTGYPLDDVWSVVVPIARTNEVTNPSAETATTGYTAGAGTLTRSTEQQYHGAYSFKYVPSAAVTDGFYYTLTSTVATRAVSCKFRGVAGVPYALTYSTSAGVDLVVKPFVASGRWQWIILYYTDASATTRRLYFRKNTSTSAGAYYVDGVQSETITAGELVSTYIDGDQLGLVPNQQPVAYVWNGTPHASTSTRSGFTRAGGMVIPFKKYGFLLTAMIGLGLAQPQNVATAYARIDGSYDDYTRKPAGQFTLTGRFQGRTYAELRRNRSGLAQLFDRDLIGQDQRLTLLRHVEDADGRITSSTVRALVKYETGFGGNTDNQAAETVPITFTHYLPLIGSDGESGSALDIQDSVSNANYIQVLNTNGSWSSVSSGTVNGASGDVNAIVVGNDGKVYVGGVFASASGVANTPRIAYYDPADGLFHAMGTGGAGGNVSWMAMGPDGILYAAGSFTSMGGIANTNNIAKWNGSAWSALGTGVTGGSGILAMAVDTSNNLYVGGTFTAMGGIANTLRLAKWDGSVWTALGTGANDTVRALAIGPGNIVYMGGDFTTINATSAIRVASWNGSAASALSTGMDAGVYALAIGPNNILYAGGDFTTAGGVTVVRTAYWNGVAWFPMGVGLNTTVRVLTSMPDGTVWSAGGFTSSGGIALRSPIAKWNGSTWVGSDNNLVSTVTVQAITPDRAGRLYVGYSSFGTATQGGLTTVTNPGTARAYPVIKLYGPSSGSSRIYQIVNATTGRAIYLNLTLITGEIATLTLTPDNLSFVSDFRGNIASTILSGSNEADFFLQPGANVISALSANTTVVATMYFRPTYASLDDVP
jgi:hypothetical protein